MIMVKVLWSRFQQFFRKFTRFLVEASSETRLFRHLSDYDFGVRNLENRKCMRVIFFSKYLEFNLDFKNAAKNPEKYFCFWDNCIWILSLSFLLIFTGSQYVNMQSQDLACQYKRFFRLQFLCQWTMNMIKVLWCRFQQCSGTFTVLLVERSSETGLFRHLSNHVFRVRNFGNTKAVRVIFFFKMFKI